MSWILEAGPDLSREEFVAIASMQPMLARFFFSLIVDLALDAQKSQMALRRILRRTDRLKSKNDRLLEVHWKQFWAIGHVTMLAAMGGRERLGDLPACKIPVEASITIATVRQGIGALALKGAWAIAKVGRSLLGYYKDQFVGGDSFLNVIEAALALYAISLRHTKLRAEVAKALARAHKESTIEPVREALASVVKIGCDDLEGTIETHQSIGAEMIVARASKIPKDSKYHFERPEDVPQSLAMAYAAHHTDDFLMDPQQLGVLFAMLPWTVRAEPEDLYLPADFLKVARMGWCPEHTLHLIARSAERDKRPIPKPEGPTRSGPCPCGSGKKYKRCCGDTRDG